MGSLPTQAVTAPPTVEALLKELTKLPSPGKSYLNPGDVQASSGKFGSYVYRFSINDYKPEVHHRLNHPMKDFGWIAWNLPVGTVLTLINERQGNFPDKAFSDLSGCGPTIDLVGTGTTETVDLTKLEIPDSWSQRNVLGDWQARRPGTNFNDIVPSMKKNYLHHMFWRQVDLNMGAIELFQHYDFKGNFATLFLSEWVPDKWYSLQDYFLQDTTSSMRWKAVPDRTTAEFADNIDGSGSKYSNVKGWGSFKEIANLSQQGGMNDQFSAFKWNPVLPKEEIIEPFTMTIQPDSASAVSLAQSASGTNNSPERQTTTVSFTRTVSDTVTVSTEESYAAEVSASMKITTKAKSEVLGNGGEFGTEFSIGLKFTYGHKETNTKSSTTTTGLTLTETINIAPRSRWSASIRGRVGTIKGKRVSTTAQRWYDTPLVGAAWDQEKKLYKRIETVWIELNGSLASDITIDINEYPLEG